MIPFPTFVNRNSTDDILDIIYEFCSPDDIITLQNVDESYSQYYPLIYQGLGLTMRLSWNPRPECDFLEAPQISASDDGPDPYCLHALGSITNDCDVEEDMNKNGGMLHDGCTIWGWEADYFRSS
jgi:hypothetical protein